MNGDFLDDEELELHYRKYKKRLRRERAEYRLALMKKRAEQEKKKMAKKKSKKKTSMKKKDKKKTVRKAPPRTPGKAGKGGKKTVMRKKVGKKAGKKVGKINAPRIRPTPPKAKGKAGKTTQGRRMQEALDKLTQPKSKMPGAGMTKPEGGYAGKGKREQIGTRTRMRATAPKGKLQYPPARTKGTAAVVKGKGKTLPTNRMKGREMVPMGKRKTHLDPKVEAAKTHRRVGKAMLSAGKGTKGNRVDSAIEKATRAGLKPKAGETKKTFLQRIMKTKKGKAALGVAAIGGLAYLLRGGKQTTPPPTKKGLVDMYADKEQDTPSPKQEAPATKTTPVTKAPAKKAAVATSPTRTAVKAPVVKAKPVSPATGRRVMALRQKHNIPSGGSITGEEAFIAAAATAIAGKVPGIYNTAHSISGFLGKNLRPLGLAGLAGGATWLIAKYLSSHRTGKPMFKAKKIVGRTQNPGPRKPSGRTRRPTMGLYTPGMSKRRKRAIGA